SEPAPPALVPLSLPDALPILLAEMSSALFATLDYLPGTAVIGGLMLVLIVLFVITSANSATFVLGMFTSKGVLNPKRWSRFTWRSEEHTSELQSRENLVCRLL